MIPTPRPKDTLISLLHRELQIHCLTSNRTLSGIYSLSQTEHIHINIHSAFYLTLIICYPNTMSTELCPSMFQNVWLVTCKKSSPHIYYTLRILSTTNIIVHSYTSFTITHQWQHWNPEIDLAVLDVPSPLHGKTNLGGDCPLI